MRRLTICSAAAMLLLGCARCGGDDSGARQEPGSAAPLNVTPAANGKPRAEAESPVGSRWAGEGDAATGLELQVTPGPDDCWEPGDVVELQLEARGFPVKGLKFAGPACDERLEAAVARGDLAAVHTLIEEVRVAEHWPARSPRCRTSWMGNLLHLSAASGATHLSAYLITKGVNVRGCDLHGATPLHVAASNLDLPLAKLLVGKGALVNAVDIEGRRPLWHCSTRSGLQDADPARRLATAECEGWFRDRSGARGRPD